MAMTVKTLASGGY